MDGREGYTDRWGWSATAKGSGGRVTEGGAGLRPRRSAGGDALRWAAVPEEPRDERADRAGGGAAAARGGGVGLAGADGLVCDDPVERAVHGVGPFGALVRRVVRCKVRLSGGGSPRQFVPTSGGLCLTWDAPTPYGIPAPCSGCLDTRGGDRARPCREPSPRGPDPGRAGRAGVVQRRRPAAPPGPRRGHPDRRPRGLRRARP